MIRRLAALVAVWAVVLAGPTLVGPAVPVASGHAQLVTSTPGAGAVVASSPTELRLVFSEPLDPSSSSADLLDPNGATIVAHAGTVDSADPYSLVVPVVALSDGIYTVDWRSLSASDGHVASGFFTFGVGDVAAPSEASDAQAGAVHAGHDAVTTFLETEARVLADLGSLLAFGLAVLAALVLREPRDPVVGRVVILALLLMAIGSASLLLLSATAPDVDAAAYAFGNRTGILLVGRVVLGLVGAALAIGLRRRGRPAWAVAIAGGAGLGGLVMLAAGGHAAAYASPGPLAAVVVHLLAASIWLSGVFALVWYGALDRRPERPLATLVPRFSALALVAVGLVALSGIYSDWVETRALPSIATPYEATLLIKIGLALAAFALGAVNYIEGGRDGKDGSPRSRRVGFQVRIAAEAALAIGILIATATLVSGSPPAQERPIQIAAGVSSVPGAAPPPTFELAPGRPGPTRFVVLADGLPGTDTVELQLQRLDGSGSTRIALKPSGDGTYAADGGTLPADSRWDASIVTRDAAATETGRWHYPFALDATGISEGLAVLAIDPALVVAIALLVLAVLLATYTIGGGTLPRVDRRTSRIAALTGSVAGAALGLVILIGGLRS